MSTEIKVFAVTMVRFDGGEFTVNTSAMTEKQARKQMFNKHLRPILKSREVTQDEIDWFIS